MISFFILRGALHKQGSLKATLVVFFLSFYMVQRVNLFSLATRYIVFFILIHPTNLNECKTCNLLGG